MNVLVLKIRLFKDRGAIGNEKWKTLTSQMVQTAAEEYTVHDQEVVGSTPVGWWDFVTSSFASFFHIIAVTVTVPT